MRTAWIKSVVGRGGDIFDGEEEKLLPLAEGVLLYGPLISNPASSSAATVSLLTWHLCCVSIKDMQ